MPKYGINPFTGEIVPINTPASGDGTGAGGDRYEIFHFPTLASRWQLKAKSPYATPTIYVSQIGDRVLERAAQAEANWDYDPDDAYTIIIQFDLYPCKGYVLVHYN